MKYPNDLRVKEATVINIGPVEHLHVEFTPEDKVIVLCGDHEVGKTMTAQSIITAITGIQREGMLRKHLDQMVSNSADSGSVVLDLEYGGVTIETKVTLTKGKAPKFVIPPELEIKLGARSPMILPHKLALGLVDYLNLDQKTRAAVIQAAVTDAIIPEVPGAVLKSVSKMAKDAIKPAEMTNEQWALVKSKVEDLVTPATRLVQEQLVATEDLSAALSKAHDEYSTQRAAAKRSQKPEKIPYPDGVDVPSQYKGKEHDLISKAKVKLETLNARKRELTSDMDAVEVLREQMDDVEAEMTTTREKMKIAKEELAAREEKLKEYDDLPKHVPPSEFKGDCPYTGSTCPAEEHVRANCADPKRAGERQALTIAITTAGPRIEAADNTLERQTQQLKEYNDRLDKVVDPDKMKAELEEVEGKIIRGNVLVEGLTPYLENMKTYSHDLERWEGDQVAVLVNDIIAQGLKPSAVEQYLTVDKRFLETANKAAGMISGNSLSIEDNLIILNGVPEALFSKSLELRVNFIMTYAFASLIGYPFVVFDNADSLHGDTLTAFADAVEKMSKAGNFNQIFITSVKPDIADGREGWRAIEVTS